jgi:hypothetical protein
MFEMPSRPDRSSKVGTTSRFLSSASCLLLSPVVLCCRPSAPPNKEPSRGCKPVIHACSPCTRAREISLLQRRTRLAGALEKAVDSGKRKGKKGGKKKEPLQTPLSSLSLLSSHGPTAGALRLIRHPCGVVLLQPAYPLARAHADLTLIWQ